MHEQQEVAVIEIAPRRQRKNQRKRKPKQPPPYHVVLWDDNDHTYDYVMRMMVELFAKNEEDAFLIAKAVDTSGRVIVETTHKERAELKRDQIHAYGKDVLISRCAGSMWATIEAAE